MVYGSRTTQHVRPAHREADPPDRRPSPPVPLGDTLGLGSALRNRLGYIDFTPPATNGNGAEAKAEPHPERKGITLGTGFYSPDGMRTVYRFDGSADSEVPEVSRATAYVAAAYCYAAMKWRADKLSEPPVWVAQEDAEGHEEWLRDHPLTPMLDQPSPDYDMGELLYLSSLWMDATGGFLWVKDTDNGGRVGRIAPFSHDEFQVHAADGRMYGRFELTNVRGGARTRLAEDVVYVREPNPSNRMRGLAKVDVALAHLNLGKSVTHAAREYLRNGLFPGGLVSTHPDWQPDPDQFQEFTDAVDSYSEAGARRMKPLVLTGGATFSNTALPFKDLLPGDLLDRVEATVASTFGVPAIVLQFLVGLKNSPWSQMEQAHRQAYQDTIQPAWRKMEKALSRQLLPAEDTARRRFIRFDTNGVAALQKDLKGAAEIAKATAGVGTLNERRSLMGWEPIDGEEGDRIDPPSSIQLGQMAAPAPSVKALSEKAQRDLAWIEFDVETKAQEPAWEREVLAALNGQGKRVLAIGREVLREGPDGTLTKESVERFLARAEKYLDGDGAKALAERVTPLIDATAEQAVRRVAGKLRVNFDLLQPGLPAYVEHNAAQLVTEVTTTTKEKIAGTMARGLEKGRNLEKITKELAEESSFARPRARLIARTETTKHTTGARREMLSEYARDEGVFITKSWLSSRDARVRPSHAALDGETVAVGESYSDGSDGPHEPNCRCTETYAVEDGDG